MNPALDALTQDLIPLEDVCEKMFNVNITVARRKAALNTLPVPAFRISNSRKGPLYVRKTDLAALLEARYKKAHGAQQRMEAAGAV